jgi:hypothetical protein
MERRTRLQLISHRPATLAWEWTCFIMSVGIDIAIASIPSCTYFLHDMSFSFVIARKRTAVHTVAFLLSVHEEGVVDAGHISYV